MDEGMECFMAKWTFIFEFYGFSEEVENSFWNQQIKVLQAWGFGNVMDILSS